MGKEEDRSGLQIGNDAEAIERKEVPARQERTGRASRSLRRRPQPTGLPPALPKLNSAVGEIVKEFRWILLLSRRPGPAEKLLLTPKVLAGRH